MFDDLLSEIEDRSKQFTVYRSGDVTDVEEQFASQQVAMDHRQLPHGGPPPFVVIEEDGEFAGAISLSDLAGILEPPIVRPHDRTEVSPGYRVLFDVLEETIFSALTRRQLLAVSREIEDRACRVGHGALHVGFQTLAVFQTQVDAYRYLASATDLDIHVYGFDGWKPPHITGITYHESDVEALGRYWILAFDGGSDQRQACGLIGQEREDRYRGFWTDDHALVQRIIGRLPKN